ncbi:MAG: SDR family NAD(P)-dependent oxidoreductase, partial [Geminicoccaceae bacterium]
IADLVNNAANDDRHRIEEVTAAYWDERIAINLRHQFFAAQAVIPGMRRSGGGSIINFGSMTWHASEGGYPAYATCKAAVEGLTRSLARDLGPDRIRVNTIVPGWVMTERQMRLWLDAEGEAEIARRQCLKDKLQPEDVARMALFLAADDSRMCTAQNFIVDAGWI